MEAELYLSREKGREMLNRLQTKLAAVGRQYVGQASTAHMLRLILHEGKNALQEWLKEENPPIAYPNDWMEALKVKVDPQYGGLGFYWEGSNQFREGHDLLIFGGRYKLVMTDLRTVAL